MCLRVNTALRLTPECISLMAGEVRLGHPSFHAESVNSAFLKDIDSKSELKSGAGPQRKISWRLFNKNTAPCELARGCIGGDA